jgi:hypothetical protein
MAAENAGIRRLEEKSFCYGMLQYNLTAVRSLWDAETDGS